MDATKVLLLVGSPRGKGSTSFSMLSYLGDKMNAQNCEIETVMIHKALRSTEGIQMCLDHIQDSDVIVLAAPLYVDSLPMPVIQMMEVIVDHRRRSTMDNRPLFVSIVNSGFPEAAHNLIALDICRIFAKQAHFEWGGGLPFGGGQAVNGTKLDEAGGRARHVKPAIDILSKALAQRQATPIEAIERISKSIIPTRLYTMSGKRRWNAWAKRNGVLDQLAKRPYQTTSFAK